MFTQNSRTRNCEKNLYRINWMLKYGALSSGTSPLTAITSAESKQVTLTFKLFAGRRLKTDSCYAWPFVQISIRNE